VATLPITLPNESGVKVITVTATDMAGNVGLAQVSITVTVGSGNQSPVVNAGQDQVLPSGDLTASLIASVTDDGLPVPAQILTAWTLDIGAPGAATFSLPDALTTSVTVTVPGTYRFRLSASDGELTGTDEVVVLFSSGTEYSGPAPNDRLHLLDISADSTPNGVVRRVLESSADGRFVLALTAASLTTDDTDTTEDLVLWDRVTGMNRLLPSQDEVIAAGMSDDGQTAVILAKDSAGTFRIDDLNITTGVLTASMTLLPSTATLTGKSVFSLSGDGRYFAFATTASYSPADTNGTLDIYRVLRASGAMDFVSTTAAGVSAAGDSDDPRLSFDGNVVVFHSTAQLIPEIGGLHPDIYVRDFGNGTIERVSTKAIGTLP
jgi:hypothetical protein